MILPLRLLPVVLLTLAAPLAAADPAPPLVPVERLALDRYLGRWHEIARYPNRFQRDCAGETTADYRRLDDGRIEVTNRCRRADGTVDEAVGIARRVGAEDSATLKVRFAPAWLGFLPAVWGDYWVIDLDPGYQLAAVSEPGRQYLWILARSPQVDAAALGALLDRLAARGFEPQRLLRAAGTP